MKLELLADAVLIEMQDLDATCERAIKLMSLHQKLEGLRRGRIMLYGKHEPKHYCPECGQETTGTISEGGTRWAVCNSCYRQIMAGEVADPVSGYGYDPDTRTGSQGNIDGWE